MKVTREQAAANREKIVEVASILFRKHGFDGIGVADIMKAAGLTHGGFYGHFKSKDDLAAEACGRALARSTEAWEQIADTAGDDAFAEIVRHYVSAEHRDEPGQGCALAALAPEATRHGRKVRRTFTHGLK